jgi:uncharacterized protein YfcZ (UPF0381/DUF406 family)
MGHLIRPSDEEYYRQLNAMTEKARRAAAAECAVKKDFRDFDSIVHEKMAAIQRGEL